MIEQDLNIIIRFTARSKIGSGHLFHSLSLFKEFQAKNIQLNDSKNHLKLSNSKKHLKNETAKGQHQ